MARYEIKAWSASRVFTFEECPAKLRYRAIDKLPEPEGPPLVRGKRIHAEGEAYLKAKHVSRVPDSFSYLDMELRKLRKQKAVSEEQWGFDAGWNEVSWWDATIRMVLDARAKLKTAMRIVDFKTGRPRPEKDEDQLGLYAAGAFERFPGIKTAITQLWYLDLGDIVELRFNAEEAQKERKAWESRAQKMLDDTQLDPTPGYACKWCSFGKSKGGPCKEEKLR